MVPAALATLALAWAALAHESSGRAQPPPGLVFVEGGKTRIGTTVDATLAQGLKLPNVFSFLAAETPAHERRVESFHLMVSEVTNEQYMAYVRASGTPPPRSWGRTAIEEASRAFALDAERAGKEAGASKPSSAAFDPITWWREHWREARWDVPAGEECLPVAYVGQRDALGYARWAGLRLMTEFEFQRAGRGNTNVVYPWGNDWDDKRYCANKALHLAQPDAVGSFPAGATRAGVCDLSGNVWEWTASPYAAYPGYKELQIKVPKAGGSAEIVDSIARFDEKEIVLVGGSFQNGPVEARLSVRRPLAPEEATEAIGFRCAASIEPWIDLACAVLAQDLGLDARQGAGFSAELAFGVDRWQSDAGTATRPVRDASGERREPLPGYAVIRAYDHILYLPAVDLALSGMAELRQQCATSGWVRLGVMAQSRPTVAPKLPAGAWFVAFRPAGPAAGLSVPGDPAIDQFLFLDPQGVPVAAVPAGKLEFGRPPPGSVTLTPASAEGTDPDRARVRGFAGTNVSGRGYAFEFQIEFAAGTLDGSWR